MIQRSSDDDKRLLQLIKLTNFLSFGPETPPIDLKSLNIIIGINGVGKSNLIEAVALMRATPVDIGAVVRKGGGASEWIWKGKRDSTATIEVVVSNPKGKQSLVHLLSFYSENGRFQLNDETVENEYAYEGEKCPYFYYHFEGGHPIVNTNDRLEEDFSNLGLFLNRISRQHPKAKKEILEGLGELYENLSDFNVSIEGGTVQVFLTENEFTIPATRLSDGTLRYLCLLAILCDPEPPSLICIEEPELGLHPDILPKLADYLVAASKRTQLMVTTHSDILIDAMTEIPEVVLVCEKHNGCTEIRRLKQEDLKDWLEKYRLGELWIPKLVSCGGRDSAFKDFQTAHANKSNSDYVAMLIDSEDILTDLNETWNHLKIRDSWDKPPGSENNQVLFMTTCMETWIVADRDALTNHYGSKLQESALPPLVKLESRSRQEIQERLLE